MQYSPLINAVRSHNLALCRQLVLNGADVNEQVTLGTTALHMACMVPAEEGIMEFLLSNNANPEIENVQESTPLMVACRVFSFANAALLLKYGANVDNADSKGHAVLFHAVRNGNPRNLVKEGDARSASILIEHGANVNYATTDGKLNSPILFSVLIYAPQLMRLLLAHGADILHENSTGENAFFLAC
eukprot:gene29899-33746_t